MAQTKIKRKQFSDDGWIPANETWTYASADDPTYTFTISAFDATAKYSAGMKVKLTQSTGGTKFAIITKVVFDDPGSTITAYFGTDYNLENEAITLPYYSLVKAPFGFPLAPDKWTVQYINADQEVQATPTGSTWYNIGSNLLSVPIGSWYLSYKANVYVVDATAGLWHVLSTLSTANNSESNVNFTTWTFAESVKQLCGNHYAENLIGLASKTTYYLNAMTLSAGLDNLYVGLYEMVIIRAVCAYL